MNESRRHSGWAVYAAVGATLLLPALAAFWVWLAWPFDVVRDRYATLADARADGLFERGWLPDVLPSSARDIEVNNNLDLNSSWGRFHFSAADGPDFVSRLSPLSDASRELSREIEERISEGDSVREVVEAGSVWVFVCDVPEGRCHYSMTLRTGRD
jgi:hypothetical protein